MRKIALILEGQGDVAAGPALISRSAASFGEHVFAADPPIRAGNALKLRRPGELERYLRLAASRDEVEQVIVLVDLDDGCAAEFAKEFSERALPIAQEVGKAIDICFCVREYEVWFLASLDALRAALPDYGIEIEAHFEAPETIRAAKGALNRVCRIKGYKQMRDQLLFTRKLNIRTLAARDRSFRKLLKSLLKKDYDEIRTLCNTTSEG